MSSQNQQTQKPTSIPIDTSTVPLTTGPTSPQLEKDAPRAMSATDSWKPSMDRRQSYHKEDHKHALQMSGLSSTGGTASGTEKKGDMGFSERS